MHTYIYIYIYICWLWLWFRRCPNTSGQSSSCRKGTNGVSTSGVTAKVMFFDRGTFWVLLLTYFYLPKSARAYLFPQSVKINYFCSGPISVDPICPQPTGVQTHLVSRAAVSSYRSVFGHPRNRLPRCRSAPRPWSSSSRQGSVQHTSRSKQSISTSLLFVCRFRIV